MSFPKQQERQTVSELSELPFMEQHVSNTSSFDDMSSFWQHVSNTSSFDDMSSKDDVHILSSQSDTFHFWEVTRLTKGERGREGDGSPQGSQD